MQAHSLFQLVWLQSDHNIFVFSLDEANISLIKIDTDLSEEPAKLLKKSLRVLLTSARYYVHNNAFYVYCFLMQGLKP